MKSANRKMALVAAMAMFGAATVLVPAAQAKDGEHGRGNANAPVIYVTSQDLLFDSIVLSTLPNKGPFQKLEMGGPSGLMTEFGPGDREYVGGRWWLDVNGNNEMDGGDLYFSCPLLGPGTPPTSRTVGLKRTRRRAESRSPPSGYFRFVEALTARK